MRVKLTRVSLELANVGSSTVGCRERGAVTTLKKGSRIPIEVRADLTPMDLAPVVRVDPAEAGSTTAARCGGGSRSPAAAVRSPDPGPRPVRAAGFFLQFF